MNVEDRRKKKLAEVKLAMAKRYESRAKVSGSRPRCRTLMHHAESYRQQAADLLAQVGK